MRQKQEDCIDVNNKEKNTYVKKQLRQALIELLKTKKIENISVSELTTRAVVGRASFYRNYEKISDILYEYDRDLLTCWGKDFTDENGETFEGIFSSLFQHYKDNEDFYMILYRNNLTDTILQTILNYIGVNSELTNKEAYSKSFWGYGIYGWLLQWMGRGMQEDATAIGEMLRSNQE